jgi:hypothetical protein
VFLVVADEAHKDVVVGSYETLDEARAAVAEYNAHHPDPFCWIEQSLRTPGEDVALLART